MLSRFYFSNPTHPSSAKQERAPQDHRTRKLGVWMILIVLTLIFALWLIYRWFVQPAWPTVLPDIFQESLQLIEAGLAFTLAIIWVVLYWRYRTNSLPATKRTFSLDQLLELSPKEFEQYVAGLFRQKGYRVNIRGRSGDHGVDLELFGQSGKKAVVQCKRYQKTVGEEIVRELYGTLIHERASRAFLVTTADISESAKKWSQGKPITLIDGRTLIQITESMAESQPQQDTFSWPRPR